MAFFDKRRRGNDGIRSTNYDVVVVARKRALQSYDSYFFRVQQFDTLILILLTLNQRHLWTKWLAFQCFVDFHCALGSVVVCVCCKRGSSILVIWGRVSRETWKWGRYKTRKGGMLSNVPWVLKTACSSLSILGNIMSRSPQRLRAIVGLRSVLSSSILSCSETVVSPSNANGISCGVWRRPNKSNGGRLSH